MEFEVIEHDDVISIAVAGDINPYTSKSFKDALFEIIETGNKNITLDFSRADYMDSSGIGSLISLYKIQSKRGKKLLISKANEDINNFIRLAGLSDLIAG
ncbi:MAG TPA: STAS domain-containing protein [Spirochaetota bacterium]|nr:STAS domain-containing protein [Spirochaetota bacterium]HPL17953.1 STAS domain-containing protein [Spirochaetota bacterium]HQJ70909.1 STAS domain-containing protein [Spirochaetota bacterium]HRS77125.1 STAS domain-containing protein [Spirochaetota bacterium]HRT75251.1 STAS domain-containing protein [Spirochaetota bacterium]